MKRFRSDSFRRLRLLTLIVAVGLASWQANRALACACCSDPGTRIDAVVKVLDFHRTQNDGMKFGTSAELFMTDASEDGVKGISAIADNYRLTVNQDAKQWRFTFRTEDGKT